MYADANDEVLRSFAEKVAESTGQEVSWVPELCCYQLNTKSWGALAVKMHHYFFIARNDAASVADFDAYTRTCVDWGLKHYQGFVRGMQKGVAIYPVLLQANPSGEVVAYTKQKPDAHWAAFALPVVVNLSTGAIDYLEKTPIWGFAMWKGIRKAASEALGQAAQSVRGMQLSKPAASGGTGLYSSSEPTITQKYGGTPRG